MSTVDPAPPTVVGANGALALRLWSALALVLALLTVALAVVVAVTHLPRGLVVLACAVLAGCAAWYGVRRRGWARTIGVAAAAALLAAVVVLAFVWNHVLQDLLLLVVAAATLAATRRAFKPRAHLPSAARPAHPVLFYNPKSGGGKAAKFHLADEAARRGIEAIELRLGEDLEELVRGAVARGADGLAMAGGDGSQAIVAMVAAELDLPYACIPSGTRNHFALDLGVDRDDVVGALDAFVAGRERRVDLADVNGQVFVNNVSLGLYADAVARPGYREAKLHTLLDAVPDAVGPEASASNMHWHTPDGEQSAVAILVSNNAYRLGRAIGSGTRPRLDEAVLGVAVLAPVQTGEGRTSPRWGKQQWTTPVFEIDADGPVAAGIDGESVQLSAPLRFRIRPGVLRARIAPHHPGASPSALEPDGPWGMVQALVANVVHGAAPARAR
ncbi:MAG TPA: diacylglycerol kinase family protein [Solirubrobacteraceae bacterium]|nr:diacylglycerol kinase family protein [Solirubrobacteraceae bacterium]